MAHSTRFFILLSIIMLITSGCLRETNDVEGDSVSVFASPSPTFSQSIPSSEDIISNPVAQSVTGNQDAQAIPDAPNDEISSFDGDVSAPQDEVQQQQFSDEATPTTDPLYARATQIIIEATQTSIAQTETAYALQQPLPTFTPGVITQPDQPQFVPTFTPAPTAIPLAGADCVHEVVQGENLFRLSLRYGVLVNDIARSSGITNINLILVGQKLTIPGCGTTGVRPPATSIPTQSVSGISGASSFATPVPSAGGVTHIVQQGETLFQISLRYGVPVNNIAARNGISNINLIYINQELIIP